MDPQEERGQRKIPPRVQQFNRGLIQDTVHRMN
jgi:hypothetical protein